MGCWKITIPATMELQTKIVTKDLSECPQFTFTPTKTEVEEAPIKEEMKEEPVMENELILGAINEPESKE